MLVPLSPTPQLKKKMVPSQFIGVLLDGEILDESPFVDYLEIRLDMIVLDGLKMWSSWNYAFLKYLGFDKSSNI